MRTVIWSGLMFDCFKVEEACNAFEAINIFYLRCEH